MKNLYILLILVVFTQLGNAQICAPKTVPGSTVDVFDWRTDFFEAYLRDENQQTYPLSIPSPFYTGNSEQYNTAHFAASDQLDYKPEDGWEVIFHHFGTEQFGAVEPSFALYNRKTGLFRFFMFTRIYNNTDFHEMLIITTLQNLGSTFFNSALLESMNPVHHAIEEFDKRITTSTVNRFKGSQRTWIVSEWLTHYDPCTCRSSMRLGIIPKLQNISSLELNNDEGQGVFPIYSADEDLNNGDIRISIGGRGNSTTIDGKYTKGQAIFKNFQALETVLSDHAQDVSDSKSSPFILKKIVKSLGDLDAEEDISEAAHLISGVNSLVGNSTNSTLSSYSSFHRIDAVGEADSRFNSSGYVVYVPGGKNENYPEAHQPIYNNILGVASVLENIKVDWFKGVFGRDGDTPEEESWEEFYNYKLTTPIYYAINTQAGFDAQPKDVKVSMYFDVEWIEKFDYENGLPNVPGMIWVNQKTLRTPYMNPSCLYELDIPILSGVRSADFSQKSSYSFNIVNEYVTLALLLDSEIDSSETGYIKSYEVIKNELEFEGKYDDLPVNDYFDVPEDLTIDYKDIHSDLQTWGSTTILNVPENGIQFLDSLGMSTWEVLNDGSQNTDYKTYITNHFTLNFGENGPVNKFRLSGFCNSARYKAKVPNTWEPEDTKETNHDVLVYPNPMINSFTIEVEKGRQISYQIIDVLGYKVADSQEYNGEQILVNHLPSGVYYLTIFEDKKVIKEEKIVKI